MKKILYHIIIVATILFVACSKGEQDDLREQTGAVAVNVKEFPTYNDTSTRVVGIPDEGKTAWAEGDKVFLKLQMQKNGINQGAPLYHTLTYNGTQWESNNSLPSVPPTNRSITVDYTAYYAPAYQWNSTDGTLSLMGGKVAGMDEYLIQIKTGAVLVDGITIDFSGTRNYSRLRIATPAANASIKLVCANFKPVNTTAVLGTTEVSFTADAKGNAYFYGTWTAETTMDIKTSIGKPLFFQTGIAASVNGHSYAADATQEIVSNIYITTFDVNGGGVVAPSPAITKIGSSLILPEQEGMIPPPDKMFIGWATTPDPPPSRRFALHPHRRCHPLCLLARIYPPGRKGQCRSASLCRGHRQQRTADVHLPAHQFRCVL